MNTIHYLALKNQFDSKKGDKIKNKQETNRKQRINQKIFIKREQNIFFYEYNKQKEKSI